MVSTSPQYPDHKSALASDDSFSPICDIALLLISNTDINWYIVSVFWTTGTCRQFEVDAVAVVSVAAVVVDQTFGPPAVDWLSQRLQVLLGDTPASVLLLAVNQHGGGHASAVCFTPVVVLLTLGDGAVTPQSCRDTGNIAVSATKACTPSSPQQSKIFSFQGVHQDNFSKWTTKTRSK